jgi:Zn-dependent M28 family amino/carboxypeptidase
MIFVSSFSAQTFAQSANFPVSTQEQIEQSVKLAPCDSKERFNAVKNLFETLSAKKEDISVEKFNKNEISNLVVKVKGKTEDTIIVGAHYDKTKEGCGAIDNWTGITIIVHLYQFVAQIQPEKSYLFVAFDGEEKGLFGSEAMAKAIPKERRQQYCSMINFDSFGFGLPQIMGNTSTSKLAATAKKIAKDMDFRLAEASILNADADSSSFERRNIPSITFHGLDNNWQKYLHSDNDKISKINFSSVYYGYRFGLVFITKLDKMSCSENTSK